MLGINLLDGGEFRLSWLLQVNTAALTALSGALLSWFRHILTQLNIPAYLE